MSERINDGGSAFPETITVAPDGERLYPSQYGTGGMSLRDYFAAQALAGVVSAPMRDREDKAATVARIAVEAYRVADAMIAEREVVR